MWTRSARVLSVVYSTAEKGQSVPVTVIGKSLSRPHTFGDIGTQKRHHPRNAFGAFQRKKRALLSLRYAVKKQISLIFTENACRYRNADFTFIHEPSLEDTAAFDSVQRSFSSHTEHYGENPVTSNVLLYRYFTIHFDRRDGRPRGKTSLSPT